MLRKITALILSISLIITQPVFAQGLAELNIGKYLNQMPVLNTDSFRPAHLRYISYDIKSNDFKLLLDQGDFEKSPGHKVTMSPEKSENALKIESKNLFNYFLIGLSLPNDKFWVNLRPDAPEQIIDPLLEKTDMGKIMLEADLQLKKDTAGWTSPQNPEGKEYWDKLYKKAGELFGSENITIPTITRPWIVPGEVIIREGEEEAYIYKANLKVMLEEDYLTGSGGWRTAPTYQQYTFSDPRMKELNKYSTQLIRELILPKLTQEINTSKKYAQLRQVFFSLILSRWFKDKYQASSVGNGLKPFPTIDSGDLINLTSKDPWSKEYYFNEYKKSFQQGEYSLKEQVSTPTGQVIRSYVSGGVRPILETINSFRVVLSAVDESPERMWHNKAFMGGLIAVVISGFFAGRHRPNLMMRFAEYLPVIIEDKDMEGDYAKRIDRARNMIRDLLGYCVENESVFLWPHNLSARTFQEIFDGYSLAAKEDLTEAVRKARAALVRFGVHHSEEIDKKLDSIEGMLIQGSSPLNTEEMAKEFYDTVIDTGVYKTYSASMHIYSEIDIRNALVSLLKKNIFKKYPQPIGTEVKTALKIVEDYFLIEFNRVNPKDSKISLKEADASSAVVLEEEFEKVKQAFLAEFKKLNEQFLLKEKNQGIYNKIKSNRKLVETFLENLPFLALIKNKENFTDFLIGAGVILDISPELYPEMKDELELSKQKLIAIVTSSKGELEKEIEAHIKKYSYGESESMFKESYNERRRTMLMMRELWLPQVSSRTKEDDERFRQLSGAWETLDDFIHELSSSSIIPNSPKDVDSPLMPGGIDFTRINYLTQPMGSFQGLDLRLPFLSKAELEGIDINKELASVEQMINARIDVSTDRLKRLLAAMSQKDAFTSQRETQLLPLLLRLCWLKEEKGAETTPDFRAVLLIADTGLFVEQGNTRRSLN